MNIRQRGHECFYTLSKPAHINWASSTAADYHNRFLRVALMDERTWNVDIESYSKN